jgi:hypothetical protein
MKAYVPPHGGGGGAHHHHSWRYRYKEAMCLQRVPGWLVAAVLFSHMACCPNIWEPWAANVLASARQIRASPPPPPTTTTTTTPPPPPVPPDDDEDANDVAPESQKSWLDIVAMDPLSMAEFLVRAALDGSAEETPTPLLIARKLEKKEEQEQQQHCRNDQDDPPNSNKEHKPQPPCIQDAAALLGGAAFSFLVVWTPSIWRGESMRALFSPRIPYLTIR